MGRLETRSARRTATVGVLVLALIAAVLYLAGTLHRGLPLATTTTVKAAFADVHSLKVGDEVRHNSVRIGKVDHIELITDTAVVTMRLDGEHGVHSDAAAAIWDFSALGTKFVELHPGTPESGPLGDRAISVARTVDSNDLHELFGVFDEDTRDAATGAIRELGSGTAGLSRELHEYLAAMADLLTDTGVVSEALTAQQADLAGLVERAHRLSARFAGREQQITDLLAATDTTLRALTVDDGAPLSESLGLLPSTVATARTGLDAVAEPLADLGRAAADLRVGAESLGASAVDLRGVLVEGVAPLKQTPDVAQLAEPAISDLTQTLSDARPLAPMVATALDAAATPLTVLAQYTGDISAYAAFGRSFLAEDVNGLHYARIGFAPGLRTWGGLVLDGEHVHHNHYPAPGEARKDRVELSGGGQR